MIKFVDFGAAKILAKNQRTMQRTRKVNDIGGPFPNVNGLAVMSNGLTGTPMYMSPEIIKNDKRGRYGASDIWSLGCVILECATGRKPWSNLDNEWYVLARNPVFYVDVFFLGRSCSTSVLPRSTHRYLNLAS